MFMLKTLHWLTDVLSFSDDAACRGEVLCLAAHHTDLRVCHGPHSATSYTGNILPNGWVFSINYRMTLHWSRGGQGILPILQVFSVWSYPPLLDCTAVHSKREGVRLMQPDTEPKRCGQSSICRYLSNSATILGSGFFSSRLKTTMRADAMIKPGSSS